MPAFLKLASKKIEIQWINAEIKDRPCLIFLHEGLGCTRMWKDFPEKLSKETRCPALVFSRFGYGRSDPARLPWKINFMHQQALDILPDIIKSSEIQDHILIGHSDGGSIGIIFAGSPLARNGLKGLITEAAHVFCERVTVQQIQQAKFLYHTQELKTALEKYHGTNTDIAFRGWNDVWLNPGFMNWNIEKYLGRIQVPMLAIQGKNDQYGTIKQIHAIQEKVSRVQTVLLDDCLHSPHKEHPELVLTLMSNFIHQVLFNEN